MTRTLKEINEMGEAWVNTLTDANDATQNVNNTTQDYKKLMAELTKTFKPLLDSAKDQIKAVEDLKEAQEKAQEATEAQIKAQEESREAFMDSVTETQRFKDSLMEVQREIMEVTHVTKGMDKSMFQAMSGSKVWTAASRLLSGTGLWSVQNAVRGVIDVVSIYQTSQQKKIEITQRATKAMENYGDAEAKYLVEAEKVRKHLKNSDHAQLMEDSLSYKLMIDRGIDKNDAMKLLGMEMDAMDLLLDKQKKLILGGKVRQKIRAAIAKQEAKIMPSIKKFLYGDPDDKTGKSGLFGKRATMGTSEVKWTQEEIDEEKKAGRDPRTFDDKEATAGSIRIEEKEAEKSGMEMFMDNWKEANVWEVGDKAKGHMVEGVDSIGGEKSIRGMAREQLTKQWNKPNLRTQFAEGVKGKVAGVKDFWTKHGEKAKVAMGVITGLPLLWKLWKTRSAISAAVSGKMLKIMPAMSFVFTKMKIALTYFLMAILIVFIVVKVIQMAWAAAGKWNKWLQDKGLEVLSLGTAVGNVIGTLFEWFGSLWKIVYSAFTGDFDGLIDGIFEFGLNTLLLGVDLLMLGLSLLATLAIGVFFGFVNWLQEDFWGNTGKLMKALGTVLAVWGAWMLVKWLVAAITSYIIGIWGFIPTLITMAIVALVVVIAVFKDDIIVFFENLWEDIKNLPSKIGEFIKGDGVPYVPFLAKGGDVTGSGLAVVGEEGPELVRLPRGARVHSNKESQALVSNNPMHNTININVNGRLGASDKELRDLANKVGRLINKEINRTTSASGRLG